MRVISSMGSINQPRNPILLVHGIEDTGLVFSKMSMHLQQCGWNVYAIDLVPNNGDVGLDALAQQVADYISENFPQDQMLDIVGFSMGGIVSRYYVQRLGGIKRVQRFITISSPHHGTIAAYASKRPGCVQMRPDSLFIKDLNSDALMLKDINFTSIWTPYDLIILPANSSQMPFGNQVIIPSMLHPWMLLDIRSLKAVEVALGEPVSVNQKVFPKLQNQ
jgi:triacylglycerol lipase